jgi:hypothetical protein
VVNLPKLGANVNGTIGFVCGGGNGDGVQNDSGLGAGGVGTWAGSLFEGSVGGVGVLDAVAGESPSSE